jgi:phosphomannomutase
VLRFGTAGVRGPLGNGPDAMNVDTASAIAAGIATWLPPGAAVLVGHDARHGSVEFAAAVARSMREHGISDVTAGQVPTPLLAFATRRGDYSAGVMVTASHNPATDNGIKVYDGAGAQVDDIQAAEIEAAITAPRDRLPLIPLVRRTLDIAPAYLGALPVVEPGPLTIAYTPLHGVGAAITRDALRRSGFNHVHVVEEQAEPDPDFPTVPFPNPELPGVLDLLRARSAAVGADLALAHDPDADRLAVLVGDRQLSGDELGILLADEVLRHTPGPVATTFVSSSVLELLAQRRGVPCEVTRTGFKNLVRAHGGAVVFAYEEALGYAVAPATVRDKDGISAAVLVAAMAAADKRDGRTLLDRLAAIENELGVEIATGQLTVASDDPETLLATLIRTVPQGFSVTRDDPLTVVDGDARMIVRPSGTEPKLKLYLQAARRADLPALTARGRTWLSGA